MINSIWILLVRVIISEVHHVVVPLSSSDDESDDHNRNELMDMKPRITASSPDLSETASLQSSAQPPQQKQNKTRSDAQPIHSNDERHERPNEKGIQIYYGLHTEY